MPLCPQCKKREVEPSLGMCWICSEGVEKPTIPDDASNMINWRDDMRLNKTEQELVSIDTIPLDRFGVIRENKKWTEEEDDILSKVWDKHPLGLISKNLGRSEEAVRRRIYRLGLRKQKTMKKRWTEVEDTYLEASYKTVPIEKMADNLGRTEKAVLSRLYYKGLYPLNKLHGHNSKSIIRKFIDMVSVVLPR